MIADKEYKQGDIIADGDCSHSCLPNAIKARNKLMCISPVDIGEEITISYNDNLFLSAEERNKHYDFICKCKLCRDESMDKHMKHLSDMYNMMTVFCNKGILADVALDIMKDIIDYSIKNLPEKYVNFISKQIISDAFQVAVFAGEVDIAKKYAKELLMWTIIQEGDDSPVLEEINMYIEDPTKHVLYKKIENKESVVGGSS